MKKVAFILTSLITFTSCYATEYYAYCNTNNSVPSPKDIKYYSTDSCIIMKKEQDSKVVWEGGKISSLRLNGDDVLTVELVINNVPANSSYKLKLTENCIPTSFGNLHLNGSSNPQVKGNARNDNGLASQSAPAFVVSNSGNLSIKFSGLKTRTWGRNIIGLYRYSENSNSKSSRKYKYNVQV